MQVAPPPISTAYLLTLTLLMSVLLLRLALRWRSSAPVGKRSDRGSVAIVGRFIGAAPVGLILMLMFEARGYNFVIVHVIGGTLVLGRLLFAFSLDPEGRASESYRMLRVLTWAGIAVGGVYAVAVVAPP